MTTRIWDGADAAELLTLDRSGDDFRAPVNQAGFGGYVFGGQILAQSIMAATATVPSGQQVHSLHGYFIASGSDQRPIDYRVTHLRESKSSSVRRVAALQDDRLLAEMSMSLSLPRASHVEHQAPPIWPVPPEECVECADFVMANADRLPEHTIRLYGEHIPIDRYIVNPEETFFHAAEKPQRSVWMRIPGAKGITDEAMLRALIASISDAWLFAVSYVAHMPQGQLDMSFASLDHAMWIHAVAPVDDWLLYITESPWAGSGRGLGRGLLYDRKGRLIASTGQEGVGLPNRPWQLDTSRQP